MHRLEAIALCALMGACGTSIPANPAPTGQAATNAAPHSELPPFVGLVWLSADPSSPPGTIRIFLPDGTLLMDSCGETYRLARWRTIDERRIEWEEDSARIEAAFSLPAPGQLALRLQLVREVRNESYVLAKVPSVCPDMPRAEAR